MNLIHSYTYLKTHEFKKQFSVIKKQSLERTTNKSFQSTTTMNKDCRRQRTTTHQLCGKWLEQRWRRQTKKTTYHHATTTWRTETTANIEGTTTTNANQRPQTLTLATMGEENEMSELFNSTKETTSIEFTVSLLSLFVSQLVQGEWECIGWVYELTYKFDNHGCMCCLWGYNQRWFLNRV